MPGHWSSGQHKRGRWSGEVAEHQHLSLRGDGHLLTRSFLGFTCP